MRILDFRAGAADGVPCVIALGGFDGMHLGHRRLLAETVKLAKTCDAEPCVFTFSDLSFKGMPQLLSTEEKYAKMEKLGIRRVFVATFEEVRRLSPWSFFLRLSQTARLRGLVCGFNFRFGAGGVGTPGTLTALAQNAGVPTVVVPPVSLDGVTVSSTAVRAALTDGRPEKAAVLLGEPYVLCGTVVHGKGLGHTLSFPTLNLPLDPHLLVPRKGVYLTVCHADGTHYPAVSNIGVRPTVEKNASPNCESHLLIGEGDLYGRRIRVSLLRFLRDELPFSDTRILQQQVARDTEYARAWFSANPEAVEEN